MQRFGCLGSFFGGRTHSLPFFTPERARRTVNVVSAARESEYLTVVPRGIFFLALAGEIVLPFFCASKRFGLMVRPVMTGAGWTSKAPMSQIPKAGRGAPRASVDGQPKLSPLFLAGLRGSSPRVGTGPPLNLSGARSGCLLNWSPVPWKPHWSRLSMLWPSEVRTCWQFSNPASPWPALTIVFFKRAGGAALSEMSPPRALPAEVPDALTELSEIVEFTAVKV